MRAQAERRGIVLFIFLAVMHNVINIFFKDFIYLFEREKERIREREKV